MKRYSVWRQAGTLTIYRSVGLDRSCRVEFRPHDYYDWPLSLDGFTASESDYEGSDDIHCPCGETLSGWDGTAGCMLSMIYMHCDAAGHPKPRYEP